MKAQFTVLGLRFTLEVGCAKKLRFYPESYALIDQLQELARSYPSDTLVEKVIKSKLWFSLWETARREGAIHLVNGLQSVEFVYAHRSPHYTLRYPHFPFAFTRIVWYYSFRW